jgi:hypothetical protein
VRNEINIKFTVGATTSLLTLPVLTLLCSTLLNLVHSLPL